MAAILIAASIPLASVVIRDGYYGSIQTPIVYALSYAIYCTIALPLALAYKLLLAPHFSRLRHIPAVPQGPVLKRLIKEPNSIDFLRWMETVPNDGLLRYYGVLNGERILVTSTAGTKTVHDGDEQDFRRPHIAKAILCRLTGGGVFAAEGAHHAAQRKEMQPAFKFRHLKDLYPTFWTKAGELVASLEAFAAGSAATVDVDDWVSRGTLDAISLAGFGFDFEAIARPDSALVRKYRTAFLPGKSAARVRILANILPIKLLFNLPMKRNRDAKACISAVREEAHRVVQRRQSEGAEKQQAHNDILSALLASNLSQKTDDIVSQCMAFLAAGHEASALALGWTLYELSTDQIRQQKLRDEIRSNLPSPSSSQTVDAVQIDNLPFLSAVVTESLRLWGPVPRQTRSPLKPMMVSGALIPKDTPLVLSFYAMNRSPRNWGPDADQCEPERWIGSASAKAYGGSKDRFCYSTFSHGARHCPGQRFANSEIAIFLACLAGRFEWEFVDKEGLLPGVVVADHDSTVMLKVDGSLQLILRAVQGW